jgi:hypothetical protein
MDVRSRMDCDMGCGRCRTEAGDGPELVTETGIALASFNRRTEASRFDISVCIFMTLAILCPDWRLAGFYSLAL